MPTAYNKLVRDHIPDIIHDEGRTCETEILGEEAYRHALWEKVVEEAQEAAHAEPAHIFTELANLQEVIDVVLRLYGITKEDVATEQQRRREERGGFKRRIRLIRVDEGAQATRLSSESNVRTV